MLYVILPEEGSTPSSLCFLSLVLLLCVVFLIMSSLNLDFLPASFQMEGELERFQKESTHLKLNITQLQQKLKATDHSMHRERQKV